MKAQIVASKHQKKAEIDVLDLENYFPYWVASLSRLLVQRLQVRLSELTTLTIAEWRILALLANKRGTQAIHISKLTRLDQVAVHRAIKSLLAKNLLHREDSAEDKRSKLLQLSQQGWTVYAKILPEARKIETELLGLLSATDRKQLRKLLGSLYKLSQDETLSHSEGSGASKARSASATR